MCYSATCVLLLAIHEFSGIRVITGNSLLQAVAHVALDIYESQTENTEYSYLVMIACLNILPNLGQTYPLTKMKRKKTKYKYFQHLFSKVNMEMNKRLGVMILDRANHNKITQYKL